jgi:hypothetical protein
METTHTRACSPVAAAAWLLGIALAAASVSCEEEPDGPAYLSPVRDCVSDDECVDADSRYDSCHYVCAGDVTYCRVSCETSSDCLRRDLPEDYVYCNHPREGDGFCEFYDYDYQEGDCVENPGDPGGSGGSGSDCYSSCVDGCLEAGGTNCGADCADLC